MRELSENSQLLFLLFAFPILAAVLLSQGRAECSSMKSVYVLLANSDRHLNNIIEVAIRDACYEQVHLECQTTHRLDEVLHRGSGDEFALIFLASNNLISGPPQHASHCTPADVARAIRTLKQARSVCIMAVGAHPHDEPQLLEAGAEKVFGLLIDRDELKVEVRRALNIPEPVVGIERSRWSLASGLLRSLQKLRHS